MIKKIMGAILAVAMVTVMSTTVFAADDGIKTVNADEPEAVISSRAATSSFQFDMYPGNDVWGAYGYKDNSNANATVTVEYALDDTKLYYRVASAPNTNSFIGETKNVTGEYVFNLRYDTNQNKPRNAYLRGYVPASETRMAAQAGYVTY